MIIIIQVKYYFVILEAFLYKGEEEFMMIHYFKKLLLSLRLDKEMTISYYYKQFVELDFICTYDGIFFM